MKINLTKKQYRDLIEFLDVANYIYGLSGDMVDEKYKPKSDKLYELIDYFLEFAKDFDSTDIVDEFEGRKFVEEKLSEKHLEMVLEYDDYVFWEKLAELLSKRDFWRIHGEEKIKKMDDMEIIRGQGEIEEKYWKEFEKNGIENLELKQNK